MSRSLSLRKIAEGDELLDTGDSAVEVPRRKFHERLLSAYGNTWQAATTIATRTAEVTGATAVYVADLAINTTMGAVRGATDAIAKVRKKS